MKGPDITNRNGQHGPEDVYIGGNVSHLQEETERVVERRVRGGQEWVERTDGDPQKLKTVLGRMTLGRNNFKSHIRCFRWASGHGARFMQATWRPGTWAACPIFFYWLKFVIHVHVPTYFHVSVDPLSFPSLQDRASCLK